LSNKKARAEQSCNTNQTSPIITWTRLTLISKFQIQTILHFSKYMASNLKLKTQLYISFNH
jgi:hypothetical protein